MNSHTTERGSASVAEMIEIVEDDAVFLSLVDAAESAVVGAATKRHKISDAAGPAVEEGSYMVALRGSYSPLWQQQQQQLLKLGHESGGGGKPSGSLSSSVVGGACFKCGVAGHWARDCNAGGGREWGGGSGLGSASMARDDGDVPEKACPCGSGTCVVRTSNTAKNPGRKFYKCPLRTENGGCNFFEWCDEPFLPAAQNALNNQSSSSVPGLQCPCGVGSCLVLVTKSGKNMGRQYYRCPSSEGNGSCGFFKWCDDQGTAVGEHAFASKNHVTCRNSSSQLSGERSNSSCFKCGQEGHWSRECPNQLSATKIDTSGKHVGSTASNTCFKCGKSGHWARECSANELGAASATSKKRSF